MGGTVRRRAGLLGLWLALAMPVMAAEDPPVAGIVTRMASHERVVALTFDACEAGRRARLDHGITDYLVAHGVPFTIFMGGRFALDNAADVRELATHESVSIQNHTMHHPADLRRLGDDAVRAEILDAAAAILKVTGRTTMLFRFPGGHADERTLGVAESLGYRVVHWRWAEGDPVRSIDADMLVAQTLERTRPGDILIFHVNGRGWHTAEALPRIIEGLGARGFRFVSLEDRLPPRTPKQGPGA
jgi:peptidoglycan/xylan/chitin deacetylase (PgdA/CDA1 family)